jgi:hypothetical protein
VKPVILVIELKMEYVFWLIQLVQLIKAAEHGMEKSVHNVQRDGIWVQIMYVTLSMIYAVLGTKQMVIAFPAIKDMLLKMANALSILNPKDLLPICYVQNGKLEFASDAHRDHTLAMDHVGKSVIIVRHGIIIMEIV